MGCGCRERERIGRVDYCLEQELAIPTLINMRTVCSVILVVVAGLGCCALAGPQQLSVDRENGVRAIPPQRPIAKPRTPHMNALGNEERSQRHTEDCSQLGD